MWSCVGGVAQEVVPFSEFQVEPRCTLPLNSQVVGYFDEQAQRSSLSVTVDYRRFATLLGGENRGYTPQVANNLLPPETAGGIPY